MSVQKEIKSAQLQARKNKNKFKSGVLTALMSEVAIIGKNAGNRETTDAEALKVITKFKKGVNETTQIVLDQVEKTGENLGDKLYNLEMELAIYNDFLPKQMSENELKTAIEVIVSQGAGNIGTVMGKLKAEYSGMYDGKMASGLIKEVLNR